MSSSPQTTISPGEISAARTTAGGWTKETLARWGVPWPPPKGWRAALEAKSEAAHGKQS